MDQHLTEISNSYLFSEYLLCLGIAVPKFKNNWEFRRENRVVAKIKVGEEGQAKFYIAAAQMCTNRHSKMN
ncbi:MAG: hypothetical protein QMB40_00400 [Aeromonadaceae bacterium]